MYSQLSVLVICFVMRSWAGFLQAPPSSTISLATAIPDIPGSSNTASGQCGGCYVVADVVNALLGTVFSDSVRQIILGLTPFTFGPTGLTNMTPAPATPSTASDLPSIFIISGLTITSPTAYNIFTAYSVTSTVAVNGQCSVVAGPPVHVSPLSYVVPSRADQAVFAVSAEEAFIRAMGLPTCRAGGKNPGGGSLNLPQQHTLTANAIPYITLTAYVTVTAGGNSSMPQASSAVPSGTTLINVAPSTTSTTSETPTSQPLPIQPASSNLTSSGLSTGVRVGVDIAVPVKVVALFMLATYL